MLFAALGLTLVMIWQAWVEFQQEYIARQGAPAQVAGQPATDGGPGTANLTEDVPDAPEVEAETLETADGAPEVVPDAEQPSVTGDIISVTTDLVRAQIDPRGGDLIRVELLAHPVSVDTPDRPFILMHRDAASLFVAQGGLIGKDRDYPNHNVQFSTSSFEYDLGDEDSVEVVLDWTAPDGVVYQKVYLFTRDSYRIEVEYRINNQSDTPWAGFAYGRFDINPQVRDRTGEVIDLIRESTLQGIQCRPGSGFRGAFNEIGNRFRLGKVQPVIEECPFAELARTRDSRPEFHTTPYQQLHDYRAAMPLELQHVLSGIAAWSGEVQRNTIVDGIAVPVVKIAEDRAARGRAFPQYLCGDLRNRGAGKPDDADPALAGWGRYRDDAVGGGDHARSRTVRRPGICG